MVNLKKIPLYIIITQEWIKKMEEEQEKKTLWTDSEASGIKDMHTEPYSETQTYERPLKKKLGMNINRRARKGIIIIAIIILIILGITALTKLTKEIDIGKLTGYTALEKEETPNGIEGLEGDISTGDYKEASDDSGELPTVLEDIKISGKLELQEYELNLNNIDMFLESESLVVVTPALDIEINPTEPISLKGFSGKLSWKNSQLELRGELGKYLSKYITLNWKEQQESVLKINNGRISINKIQIPLFDVIASGRLDIREKLSLNLNLDTLIIENYEGSFETENRENKNIVVIDGEVTAFKTKIEGMEVNVN